MLGVGQKMKAKPFVGWFFYVDDRPTAAISGDDGSNGGSDACDGRSRMALVSA